MTAAPPAHPPPGEAVRPLGAFERAMARTQAHSPFNVVLLLRFASGPDAGEVERALRALQERHRLLGCRLLRRGGELVFAPGAPPPRVDRAELDDAGGWRLLVDDALARRFDLAEGPLVHAVLGEQDGGPRDLVVTLPHLLVDASSGSRLVADLLAALGARAAPAPGDEAPAALADLPRLEDGFPPRFQGWRRRARLLAALGRDLAGEVGFRLAASGLPKLRPAGHGGSRAALWELAAEPTTALLAALRRHRLTLNATLLALWASALAGARYGPRGGPVRAFTMAGLRRLVQPPVGDDALGSGWAMLRVVVQAPGQAGADVAAATAVRDQLAAALERGDAFTAYLAAESMVGMSLRLRQRMGELAVSYTGPVAVPNPPGRLHLTDLQAFVSTMDLGPALVVQHRIWEGRLLGGLVYHDHDLDAAAVAALGDEVRRRLLVLAGMAPAEAR